MNDSFKNDTSLIQNYTSCTSWVFSASQFAYIYCALKAYTRLVTIMNTFEYAEE